MSAFNEDAARAFCGGQECLILGFLVFLGDNEAFTSGYGEEEQRKAAFEEARAPGAVDFLHGHWML